ncbi:myosin-10 isoform X1 [Patella vulgata]|uniref:myosin-10 isoform X1 n=1 Tax=Patella vulgata TaxID=6465 RepID=UPI0021803AC9|nr:myosin-10 isoform X1 [Patella vulgata]
MSVQTEEANVNNAVGKLDELSIRMRHSDFGFKENDVKNIDKVIEALRELDRARLKMHDNLETETIKASVLRHKLLFLPGQIKKETMNAVNSAHQSNTVALQDLKNELDTINTNIITMGKHQQELEIENSELHPEREMIRQQHEEIISLLNQRLAEKASMQITLNETRDKVRCANQNIVDLEDGILQLKEDLIQERTEARQEKKRLKRAVADTSDQTKEQTELNLDKKKELDVLQEKLQESIGKLDVVRKKIKRYEVTIKKLEKEEKRLNSQLQKQLEMNQDLVTKGLSISEATHWAHEEFKDVKLELTSRVKRYEGDIAKELARNDDFTERSIVLQREIEEKEAVKIANTEKVRSLDKILQSDKSNLSRKAQEVGRLQQENADMEEEIENIRDSHKAVHAQLMNQIEDLREQLEKERKDRTELQTKKDSIHKCLEEIKAETQQILVGVNHKIQEGKTKHVELTNEGTHLQRVIRQDEVEIDKLQGELGEITNEYEGMFDTLQSKVSTVEEEVTSMETEIEDKNKEIEERTPIFYEFESFFQTRTELYEKTKKDIVVMKTEKNNLEEGIRKAKMDKEKKAKPQEKLRGDLKEKRDYYMKLLHEQGEETQQIEQEIYLEGCKLKTVLEENNTFDEACRKLEEEIKDIFEQMEDNDKVKEELTENLLDSRDKLVKCWAEDKNMQEFFGSRDQLTIDAFGEILARTEKREVKIGEVSEKLEDELSVLSKFLDNVARRRPKESRESKKPPSRAGSQMSQSHPIEAVAEANLKSASLKSITTTPRSQKSPTTPRSQKSPTTPRSQKSPRSDSKSPRPVSSILINQCESTSGLTRSSTTLSSHSRKSARFSDSPLPPIARKE